MKLKVKPAKASDILQTVFKQIQEKSLVQADEVKKAWFEVMGAERASHARVKNIKKSTLMVKVDSPVWLQELMIHKKEILKELKRKLGKDRITEIQFKIED